MAQLSVAVRNAMLDAIEVTAGTAVLLKLRTGAMPANCAAARTGTVLASLTLPADWMSAAAAGAKAKLGTWQDASADATGLVGYFDIFDSGAATCHVQGLVSQAWAISTAYVLNQQVHNGGNVYKCTTAGTSAGSGGPTGTGSGITDNTAVWAYLGPLDMTIDNGSLSITQAYTINSFTLNAANS